MATGRHRKPTRRALARAGKHRRPSRVAPRAAALITVPAVLCGGTAAWAFWSATGSGSATAKGATAVALGITANSTSVPGLVPGKSGSLVLTLSNSNAYPVTLTTLTSATVTSNDANACPHASVTASSAGAGYNLQVPAGSTGTTVTLPNFLTMSTSAPDGCQGMAFTVTLAFTGVQSA